MFNRPASQLGSFHFSRGPLKGSPILITLLPPSMDHLSCNCFLFFFFFSLKKMLNLSKTGPGLPTSSRGQETSLNHPESDL